MTFKEYAAAKRAQDEGIEPPLVIKNKKQLENLVVQTAAVLRTFAQNNITDRPLISMMYLQFKDEKTLDAYTACIRYSLNRFWRERLGRDTDLEFIVVCKDNARHIADVFMAQDKATAQAVAKARFPDWPFNA